jgi:hypothetical protein
MPSERIYTDTSQFDYIDVFKKNGRLIGHNKTNEEIVMKTLKFYSANEQKNQVAAVPMAGRCTCTCIELAE